MVALQPGPSLAGSSSRQTGRDLARRPAVESGQAGGSREGARGEDAVLKRGPGAVVLCVVAATSVGAAGAGPTTCASVCA